MVVSQHVELLVHPVICTARTDTDTNKTELRENTAALSHLPRHSQRRVLAIAVNGCHTLRQLPFTTLKIHLVGTVAAKLGIKVKAIVDFSCYFSFSSPPPPPPHQGQAPFPFHDQRDRSEGLSETGTLLVTTTATNHSTSRSYVQYSQTYPRRSAIVWIYRRQQTMPVLNHIGYPWRTYSFGHASSSNWLPTSAVVLTCESLSCSSVNIRASTLRIISHYR